MTYNTHSNEWRKRRFFSHKNMTTPQPENTTYKVLRLTTEGWTLVDSTAQKLTKAQCDEVLNTLVQMEGINPSSLKAVRDN